MEDLPSQNSLPASPEPTPSAAREVGYKIFFGPDGLRSGWRFLAFVALFAAIFVLVNWFLGHPGKRGFSIAYLYRSESVLFGSAVAASAIMARFERRPLGDYGLPWRKAFQARFWQGTLWGFVFISLLLLLLRSIGVFYFGPAALSGVAIAKYAAVWAGVFLLVGFAEEFLFRGYSLFTLSRGIHFWPAAFVLSAIFGGVHISNSGESWLGALNAGLVGIFFCLTIRRTGNLWFAVGAHMTWDWGETFFYGVPDSGEVAPGHLFSPVFHGNKWLTGGSVGPEGSIVCVAIILLMILLFHFWFREVKFPPADQSEVSQSPPL